MAVYFFDSSAIVKRYLNEVGTAWVSRITDVATGNKVYLAHITFVEVISAITGKARTPGLTATVAAKAIADFRSDFIYEYAPVQMTAAVIEHAADLAGSHALRGYDAVQLAAAVHINTDRAGLNLSAITLISSDVSLNAAAVAEGLAVNDPNQHP